MKELNAYETKDYGEILYEKSNAKSALDAPTGKVGVKGWTQRIYMLVLGVGLVIWFLYSLVNMAIQSETGVGMAIVAHLGAFFVLLVAELILMLTAFGGWGKFARKVFRHKLLTRQHGMEGVKTRELEEELATADANKPQENAVRVYHDYVVVSNLGETTTIARSQLQSVQCEPATAGYRLTFLLYDGAEIVANQLIPFADLPLVKKHFDNFGYTPAPRRKGYIKSKLPMVAFMCVPLLIGVALLIVRGLVLPEMPIIIGIGLVSFAVLLITAQFSDIAVIGHGVMTILAGLLFTALPIGIALTIADLVESITIATILTRFTEIHAVMSVFLGLGPMLIIIGIFGIVDCTKL